MNELEQNFRKKMKDGFFLLGTFFITDVLVSFARTQKVFIGCFVSFFNVPSFNSFSEVSEVGR